MWTVASEGLERLTSDAPFPASIEGFEYCQRRQFWEHSGKEGDSVIRDCVVVPQGLKGKLNGDVAGLRLWYRWSHPISPSQSSEDGRPELD